MFSVASSNILKREKETMTDLDYEEDVIDILQVLRVVANDAPHALHCVIIQRNHKIIAIFKQ